MAGKQKIKTFCAIYVDEALRNCQEAGYKPVFMPQVIDRRINASNSNDIWHRWVTTPSIRATGKTKQGSKVVVYAHVPNYFSNPKNIRKALESRGLVNHAGRMSQVEFQKLVDQDKKTDKEGNRLVFVIDYDKLRNSKSGVISIDGALEHPQTIPFIGGRERAEKYLQKFKKVYDTSKIGIWHRDDSKDESLGRLLWVGCGMGTGLEGYSGLRLFCDLAYFFGVRASAKGTKRRK